MGFDVRVLPARIQARAIHSPCDLAVQFDLSEDKPVDVLRALWANLKTREAEGDLLAGHIRRCEGM